MLTVRYKACLRDAGGVNKGDNLETCRSILQTAGIDAGHYTFGRTLLYMRDGVTSQLMRKVEEVKQKLVVAAVRIG